MCASLQNRPRLVSFSGIDGAGKSTQINGLRAQVEALGLKVAMIPFWDNVACLTGLRESTGHALFKGEKGVGSPEAPVNRRDKNVQSLPMTAFRFFLYFIDALSLRRIAQKAERSHADVVIFDRYAYDELANLNLRSQLVRAYVRFILKIVPRPHIGFLLDADPEQARARKPEYPLDFLHTCRASYLELARMEGYVKVIPPMPVEEVAREVIKNALERLSVNSSSSARLATSGGTSSPTIDLQVIEKDV